MSDLSQGDFHWSVGDTDLKDRFYERLQEVFQAVPQQNKLIVMGDFNKSVGKNKNLWRGELGSYGERKCNDIGLRLLSLRMLLPVRMFLPSQIHCLNCETFIKLHGCTRDQTGWRRCPGFD